MTTDHTMRTHPVLQNTRNTNSVNLGITTRCSMRCPHCSIDIPGIAARGEARHVPTDQILSDLEMMSHRGRLRRIHLTGGEPTLHPEFAFLSMAIKGYGYRGDFRQIRPEYLTIETNGAGYRKYREYFKDDGLFDLVFVTHYEKDAVYPGSPDNTEIVDLAEQDLGGRLVREPPVRHEQGHLGNDVQSLVVRSGEKEDWEREACSKWFDPGLPAGYYDGRLYGCCVTRGIDKNLGIPVTADWRDQITNAAKGCARCCYRGT